MILLKLHILFLVTWIMAVMCSIDCGNGWSCPDNSMCISKDMRVGKKFGCVSPQAGPNAILCKDRRFSCGPNSVCNLINGTCDNLFTHTVTKLFRNVDFIPGPIPNLTSNATGEASLVCSVIEDELPSFCTCNDISKSAGKVDCYINVLDLDTLEVSALVDPCANPMYMTIMVQEQDIGLQWKETFSAGDDEEVPIPGASIDFPGIAGAGFYVDIEIDGNFNNVDLGLGIDICGGVLGYQECASDLTSEFPIWVLDASFDFGSTC